MSITVMRPNVHITSVSSWGMVFTLPPSKNAHTREEYVETTGKWIEEQLKEREKQIIDIDKQKEVYLQCEIS
ncbi:hypothetical protein [Bacillus cytotoxicus]|uniref:hypothetical protein n=1 Tax=Bacillus cytotoxicus TaxID=580165 RepID=UPI00086403B5|nr:hypothetical protein [Bacillus cytotoxicus]AWC29277.1 hypothetical protein CG483_013710 [Bacillus cytotoxicus]AWC41403.1 hypothetical protein CG480_013710 [Bacillus cytotoxicus]AWC49334.1 hypothetical protein CG478_013710 [Bacillus cytotoxicus]AWC53349.1 hypothetical protein CG477_013670 [Bacillus cytotoxicus]AWC57476.1 hypothetical protein CG476_013695 [Bacillus cytotoxicus]